MSNGPRPIHIVPSLLLSVAAIGSAVVWYAAGPREGWLWAIRILLPIGLSVFVANAIYVLVRFGGPFRSGSSRRVWATAVAAGLPFFVLFSIAFSAIAITTVNVTNATDTNVEGLIVTYPGGATDPFDLGPNQTRTVRIAPENEGEAVLVGGETEPSAFILECCATTVDLVLG